MSENQCGDYGVKLKGENMPASKRQIELIEELQNRGAPIPENDHGNPDSSMFESVTGADKYIKKHGHLMGKYATKTSQGDWGGVLNA